MDTDKDICSMRVATILAFLSNDLQQQHSTAPDHQASSVASNSDKFNATTPSADKDMECDSEREPMVQQQIPNNIGHDFNNKTSFSLKDGLASDVRGACLPLESAPPTVQVHTKDSPDTSLRSLRTIFLHNCKFLFKKLALINFAARILNQQRPSCGDSGVHRAVNPLLQNLHMLDSLLQNPSVVMRVHDVEIVLKGMKHKDEPLILSRCIQSSLKMVTEFQLAAEVGNGAQKSSHKYLCPFEVPCAARIRVPCSPYKPYCCDH